MAALQQLDRAYDEYFAAVNAYNRASSNFIGQWVIRREFSSAIARWEKSRMWTQRGRPAWRRSARNSSPAPARNSAYPLFASRDQDIFQGLR